MIPIAWYSTIYHIVIAALILLLCIRLSTNNVEKLENYNTNHSWCIVLLFTTILFIGLRDPYASFTYLGDTRAYTRAFENINNSEIGEAKDIGFFSFMKFSSYLLNINFFYLLCASLYVYPVYITFKKWFSNLAVYALAIYVGSMSFWAFGINGVRNGLAVSFFIFSLSFMNKKGLMVLLMLVSISFHKAMLLPSIVFLISFYFRKTNLLIKIWIGCVVLSYFLGEKTTTIIQPILNSIDDIRIDIYSSENQGQLAQFMNKNFRFDFVLYSVFPIFWGWYCKKKKKYSDLFYDQLLNTYILANSVWVLFFMFAPFTNRFAYLSWFIMPVVLIYPLLKKQLFKNQYKIISFLILGNLLFTLIMFFK